MLMWSDRLLDAGKFGYGTWEASKTGSHRAIKRIPKDIIMCDWHYERRADYPSVRFFQQQGFRVLPSTWQKPDAAVALIQCARKDATQRMLGVLFTGWSAGGNGEHLMAALEGRETDKSDHGTAKTDRRHHQGRARRIGRAREQASAEQIIQPVLASDAAYCCVFKTGFPCRSRRRDRRKSPFAERRPRCCRLRPLARLGSRPSPAEAVAPRVPGRRRLRAHVRSADSFVFVRQIFAELLALLARDNAFPGY